MILVAYATKSGFTNDVASWIAEEFVSNNADIALQDLKTSPTLEGYDAAVIGSGIRAGKWHSHAVGWVTAHQDQLAKIPLATFTSSMEVVAGTPQAREKVAGYTASLMDSVRLTPVAHRSFAGAYDPDRFPFIERMIMKMMKQNQASDHRDEADVRAWARHVLSTFSAFGVTLSPPQQ